LSTLFSLIAEVTRNLSRKKPFLIVVFMMVGGIIKRNLTMKKLLLVGLATLTAPFVSFASDLTPMPIPTKPLEIKPMAEINMPSEFKQDTSRNIFILILILYQNPSGNLA
jgi:hypothetical protein